MSGDGKSVTVHGSTLCVLHKSDVSFPPLSIRIIALSSSSAEINKKREGRLLRVSSFNREKGERKEGKEGASDGLGWFNPDPGSRRRSGQPEVFRFYSGSDLGIREAGKKKKKHEHRAGETVRGSDDAGADPFLQASNLVADIMQNGYPHAHANLKTDTCRQTAADEDTRRHTGSPQYRQVLPPIRRDCCESAITSADTGGYDSQTFKCDHELSGPSSQPPLLCPAGIGLR